MMMKVLQAGEHRVFLLALIMISQENIFSKLMEGTTVLPSFLKMIVMLFSHLFQELGVCLKKISGQVLDTFSLTQN